MGFSQFSPTNKIDTLILMIKNLLHKLEANTHTRSQETLDFKKLNQNQNLILRNLQLFIKIDNRCNKIPSIYCCLQKKTERKITSKEYIPGYNEQDTVRFEERKSQNGTKHTPTSCTN